MRKGELRISDMRTMLIQLVVSVIGMSAKTRRPSTVSVDNVAEALFH